VDEKWGRSIDHDWNNNCPGCGRNCATVALVDLLWTEEVCHCDQVPFPHLVRTTWHKACYAEFIRKAEATAND